MGRVAAGWKEVLVPVSWFLVQCSLDVVATNTAGSVKERDGVGWWAVTAVGSIVGCGVCGCKFDGWVDVLSQSLLTYKLS